MSPTIEEDLENPPKRILLQVTKALVIVDGYMFHVGVTKKKYEMSAKTLN